MAEAPLKYMARYKPIQFPGCGAQGQKSIKLNTYISGDVMSSNSFRTKAYLDLLRFVKWTPSERYQNGANGANGHFYFVDSGYMHAGSLRPTAWHYCPIDDIRQAFQGKGTPTRFARVLKVCDYYLKYAQIDIAALGWGRRVTELQEYVDYYIGLDCNGFVGAYLEENFPSSGVVHNVDIDSLGEYYRDPAHPSGTRYTRIDDPKLIKRSDILVRSLQSTDPEAQTRHIALVEDVVGAATNSSVKLLLAESTGAKGLSSRTATLVKISKPEKPRWRRWKLGDREYDAVLRIK